VENKTQYAGRNHNGVQRATVLFSIALLLCSSLLTACTPRRGEPSAPPVNGLITTIIAERGGRVDWGSNGIIAHSRYGTDGYYDLWVMSPDGSEARCLTCDNPNIPQLHNGQPTWQPSGNYIVFQSQDPSLPHSQKEDYVQTQPGFGKHNNLWATTPDGEHFYQLTHIRENRSILHPHFSHDGTKLMWGEKTSFKATDWAIMIADFVTSPEPHLVNVTSYQPLGNVWYETHAFSPDDSRILFTAGTGSGSWSGFNICEMEIASGEVTYLTTDPDTWDEHAHYSPDGSRIVWASSCGYPYNTTAVEWADVALSLKLDYWIMDADGSNKQRLTYFNKPGHDEYTGYPVIVADSSWSPDGNKIVATVLCGQGRENTRIVIIDLGEVPAGNE
jgi:Tol biopolymer transport system component